MLQSIRFPFHVWITSVIVGPILFLTLQLGGPNSANDSLSKFLDAYIFILPFGFFSVPCFLFLWLCYSILRRLRWSIMTIRLVLLFISLLTCYIFIAFFIGTGWKSFLELRDLAVFVSVSLPLAFSVLFYKLDMGKPF